MPAYRYLIVDQNGKKKRGQINADSQSHAARQLIQRGFNPIGIELVGARRRRLAESFRFSHTLSAADRALLFYQLATVLQGGQALVDSLSALAVGANRRVMQLLLSLREQIVDGSSLASAMSRYPVDFPAHYTASVAAAEQTGKMAEVFARLAQHAEESANLRQSVLLALLYPCLLVVVSVVVVIALLVYVMPQITIVFDGLNRDLPLMTRALLGVSELIIDYGLIVLLGLMVMFTSVVFYYRTEAGRRVLDGWLLELPVVRGLVTDIEVARFAQTMGVVCSNAVLVPDALQMAATSAGNTAFASVVEGVGMQVREGVSLSTALQSSGHFPPLLVQLVNVGEINGNLGAAFNRAATMQERTLKGRIGMLVGFLEPLLVLMMGGVVLSIVLAILVPVFDLNQMI